MATKPKPVSDFNPQSQSPGKPGPLPLAQGPKGSVGGGSKVAQPNRGGSAKNIGSYPKNAQKIRG